MRAHAQTRGHLSNKKKLLNILAGHHVLPPQNPISISEDKVRLFYAIKIFLLMGLNVTSNKTVPFNCKPEVHEFCGLLSSVSCLLYPSWNNVPGAGLVGQPDLG